jgi:glycerol-3-phosphate dehydrogenase
VHREEVDYFFDLIHHVFPTIAVKRDQIVYKFSGIRPLPRHEDTAPGFVSRDYRIEVDEKGAVPLVSLVGGKWTTFRALGESLSDIVLGLIDRTRTVSTAGRAIGGGRAFPRTEKAKRIWFEENLPGAGARADRLLARYGTRAAQVWEYVEQGADAPLAGGDLSTRELEWMVQNEMVTRLEDVVLRRTSIAFTGGANAEVLDEIADALAPMLGWDRSRHDAELEQTRELLNERHGLDIPSRTRG